MQGAFERGVFALKKFILPILIASMVLPGCGPVIAKTGATSTPSPTPTPLTSRTCYAPLGSDSHITGLGRDVGEEIGAVKTSKGVYWRRPMAQLADYLCFDQGSTLITTDVKVVEP
jgi:hypothetical protein